ncbi:hypothetical protein ARALYDRAFT_338955 [Arabidopsis lyrata subsp. lyrata]|uniref:TIR domain-containing protein n=1 Tax=Arabidopsis lyrata subsp. lyrata TaxID=81972 RepID=D7KV07_ARALL|nr:hypothetical protein ARALYDRAFT_338955 [Arabidopsis lyrata subsp. lyrata]
MSGIFSKKKSHSSMIHFTFFVKHFEELFAQTKYKEAAELAADSPRGILRTPDTIAKFRNVHVQAGQNHPLLQYFATLLTKGKLNAFESLELSSLVVNQGKKNLLENWLADDKLECTEELGDLVKTVDNDLALKIYTKARTTPKVIGKIPIYSKQDAPPQHQVFINFRGEQLRQNFVSHLVEALRRNAINVFIDNQELRGEDISILLKRIEDSRIAIVVFSSRYTESRWCLREAVKIKECVEQDMLKVLPIFYKVTTTGVKQLKGEFGDHFRDREWEYRFDKPRIERWKEALAFLSGKLGLTFDEKSSESDFIESIVKEVLRLLASIPSTV